MDAATSRGSTRGPGECGNHGGSIDEGRGSNQPREQWCGAVGWKNDHGNTNLGDARRKKGRKEVGSEWEG